MKYLMGFIIIGFSAFIFSSCSSDDDDMDIDPAIGTWEGDVVQPGFGTSTLVLTITSLTQNSTSGKLKSEVTDISNCDDTIYYCVFDSCEAQWTFKGKQGEDYLFLETTSPTSSCADGNIVMKLNGTNSLSFTWVDLTDPTNTSNASLQRVN